MTRLEYEIKATRVGAHASVVQCKEFERRFRAPRIG